MFTGIVEELGTVVESRPGSLRIRGSVALEGTRLGDSIAVNGVDLTVDEIAGDVMAFHAMPETYRRTNLGDLDEGAKVHLERSVRPTDRLSGHIVRGVVEGTATLVRIEPEGDARVVTLELPRELMPYVVVKGPICLDGVSLTVIRKGESDIAVSLVQYTQSHTMLLSRSPGDRINVETDLVARYVESVLGAWRVGPAG